MFLSVHPSRVIFFGSELMVGIIFPLAFKKCRVEKSCGLRDFCREFSCYLNCHSSWSAAAFHGIRKGKKNFLFFHFHYFWCRSLWVHLTSWQYNLMCFAKFTISHYLLLIFFWSLLLPGCSFERGYVILSVRSRAIAFKYGPELVSQCVWCQLTPLSLLMPVFLDLDMVFDF